MVIGLAINFSFFFLSFIEIIVFNFILYGEYISNTTTRRNLRLNIASGFTALPVTSGLITRLDVNESSSYPGSGSTWTNIAPGQSNTMNIAGTTSYNSAGYFTNNTGATPFGNISNATVSRWTVVVVFRPSTIEAGLARILGSDADQTDLAINSSNQLYIRRTDWYYVTNVSLNTWYIITAYISSFNETGNIKLWVNGGGTNNTPTYSTTIGGAFTSSWVASTLGCRAISSNERIGGRWNAYLMYNRELSNLEVGQIYNYYYSRIQYMP